MLHLPNCKCIFYNVIKKTHFFFFKSEFTLIQYTMAVYRYDRSTASLDGAGAAALTRIVSRQETGAGMIVGLRLETRSGFTSGNQIRLTDVFICGTGAVPYLYFEVRFCDFGEVIRTRPDQVPASVQVRFLCWDDKTYNLTIL